MRVAFARVTAGVDGHNGAVPEAYTGFLQEPRDASLFVIEHGAPCPPTHAEAVGIDARDTDSGDGSVAGARGPAGAALGVDLLVPVPVPVPVPAPALEAIRNRSPCRLRPGRGLAEDRAV